MLLRTLLLALGLAALVAHPHVAHAAEAAPNTLTAEEVANGWILLFDGETTFGWEAAPAEHKEQANWAIKDGALTVSEGPQGMLVTNTEFADYELKVEFKAGPQTNSGVFLRTPPLVTNPGKDCYELNIAPPGHAFPTGSLVERKAYKDAGSSADWRQFHVVAQGGRIQVKLDGKPILDYTDPQPLGRGHIGLQLNEGPVAFRNIKLKPLGLEPIFNGKDLTGWEIYPDMKSEFTVTKEGYLNVKDGRGQLESTGSYGDFVFQLDVFVNGKNLNSGIFFRSIPGEFTQGYESQIHNGFKDGDRTQPADYGTGGIYRRVPARKVVADDFEWFTKTVVAHGDHFAVWVNGYQVTDWTDTRKPDPNPRRGLRTEPGTLSIQGHDPTTDLNFRSFKIQEMPKR